MKRSLLLSLCVAAAGLNCVAADAASNNWRVEPASSIEFAAPRTPTFSVKGSFSNLSGQLEYDGSHLATAKIDVEIPIATLKSDADRRDQEMKGPKYFDVAGFPRARFKSTSVTEKNGARVIKGTFTLHGVSKEVEIAFDKPVVTKAGKSQKLVAVGTTSIEPKDFGLDLKNLHPDGLVKISGKVKIQINLQAAKS